MPPFESLTAMIGPTARSVARRMQPKKRKKNRRPRVTISLMRRTPPLNWLTPMWDGVPDLINRHFFENRPKGFGAGRPRNMTFPIDFAGRPLQHSRTTVWACDQCSPMLYMRTVVVSALGLKCFWSCAALQRGWPHRCAYVVGAKPYSNLKHYELKPMLQKGHKMDCPTDCPPEL